MVAALIHDKAHVENATIGEGTKIWQFASVIRGAIVGKDCTIASGTTIDGARVGDRCHIQVNVLLPPGVLLGDEVFVGPNVTICNDRWPVTHKDGFDIDLLHSGQWTVLVGNQVSIGANAVVLPGVTIGHRAMVAAGAVVDRNVPENYLLKRDGSMVPIHYGWHLKRMRLVDAQCRHAAVGS